MKQLTTMIGSLTAKFAALLLLAFGCAGSAWGASLSLKYDDYYTFEGATSVTVPGGTTAIAADGDTIHAVEVVSTPVVVNVDGTDYEVTVGKARLNFVLIDGQSNAAGNCGKLDQLPVGPDKGVAYVWSSGAMVDVTGSFDPSRTSSIGFHPALGAEWYKLTGEKTLFYNAAHSGQAIRKWASSGWTTATADAVVTILSSIDTTKYDVVRTGYYWLQGESDACPDYTADYCYYTNTDDYEAAYEVLHSAYISALTVSGLPAPYGGILTVRTRNNLNGKHSYNEYCGVRAAQQALANKYANLFMASVVTDSWAMNSTSPFSFTSDQGYSVSVDQTKNLFDNVHYKQSAYDIMGLEAADSIYKGWVQGTPATDFVLKRHDSVNTYSAGDTIVAEDNERYHGTDNTDELKAAQIVVVPTPFYGKCSDVSMTLSNGQGAVTGIMGDNGYISDYTEISEDLTLTIAMGSVNKAYTLTRSGLTETPSTSGYYWDFTQTDKKDGLVVHAVTGDGWTANDITYNNTSFTLNSSSGLSQGNANANYFTLANTVTLSKDEPWTIEWNGVMASASIVLSYWENGTRREHIWYDGNGVMRVRGSNGSSDFYSFNMASAAGKDATWYMIHDGHGKLTMAAYYNGTLLYKTTANAVVTADYHISNILGRYDASTTFSYHNSIRYMKIYNSAAKLPVSVTAVEIEQPDMGMTPQTSVTGDNFTGTITWTPNDVPFVDGGVYTATVTLTPAEGFRFVDSDAITVPSATVSNIQITDGSITFEAAYSVIEGKYNFFWDFTKTGNKVGNTFVAETGGDWSENTLTHQGTFSVSAANGLSANNSYFTMQRAAMLPSNKPWTIEWQGQIGASNFILSHPNDGSSAVAGADYIFYAKNSATVPYSLFFVPGGNAGANNVAKLDVGDASGTTGTTSDTIWYITHDGNGTLTMSCVDSGVRLARTTKANAIKKDWTFDTMLGYYALPSPQMLFSGNMKYMSIRHDGLLLNDLAISIAAPKAYEAPQTALSGDHYTGTITWSPAVSAFAAGTTYTANVVLTPEEGFRFGRGFDVTVANGTISNLSINDSSVTFDISFEACPDLQNYFWNFQNTEAASGNRMSSETGDDWAANGMSYKNTSDANKNITLNGTTGISNANAYFVFDDNIFLPKTEPWTIEWKGSVTASSVMLAYNTTGTPQGSNQLYIVPSYPTSGNTGVFFYPKNGTCALEVPNSVAQNADTRWFIMNDGSGKLYFSVVDKDGNLYYAQPGSQATATIKFNKLFGCYNMGSTDRRAYSGTMRYFKVYHSFNEDALPAAQIGSTKYLTLNDAIAAAETGSYNDGAPATATTIDLLRDTTGGFDVGVETSNLATYRTQNIILNLNNHTLTLGDPAVASGELKNKGIRVLAHSKLVVNNGVLDVTDSDVTRGLNTYGDCTLNNVSFVVPASSADFEYTVRNRGNLTLSGSTSIPSCGNKPALVIEPYQYPSASNVNAVLTCTSADVSVGAVSILLDSVPNNTGVPEVNISNGSFGAITESGSGLTLVGNVTGGFFGSIVPADLCAEDYVPVIEPDNNGKYTVREGVFVARIGDVKYESVNDAVAAATKNAYWDGAPAEATTITLLTNTTGGFDVGVETGSLDTFQAQNIILDLAGYTLSLGSPAVGSAGTKNKGIRVLANSKLVVKNGTLDVTAAGITKGMNVYGESELENVAFTVPNNLEYTVRNRGKLTLKGTTTIPNSGNNPALVVEPYEYSYAANVNANVVCESSDVTVGDMVVKLNEMTHHTTGAVNSGVPEMNISAGSFGTITEEGSAKTPKGGIIGGYFDSVVPENLCAEGYIPVMEADANNKYTVKQGSYVAQIGDVKYESVNDAVAAATKNAYWDGAPAEATTITLLTNTTGGFDVGVETGSLDTFQAQNIILDLAGYTLSLGSPAVGSAGTKNKGIRVLANSKLVVKNGTLDVTAAGITKGMNVYGECELENVAFTVPNNLEYTVRNRGKLTLKGTTTIPNSGNNPALVVEPYEYSYDANVNANVVCESSDVTVGDMVVKLNAMTHHTTGAVNSGVSEMNISAGSFGTITEEGSAKTPKGGIIGGLFGSVVPENLCAEGYIPVMEADANNKYTVKQGSYVAQIGDVKYESVPAALAAVPTAIYPNTPAEATTITLLADVSTGFDIGVETGSLSTFKTQNVVFDLDGHTMTLGHPTVGSTGTQTQGIRVLAFSKLEMINGTLEVDTTAARVTLANYGELKLTDVAVGSGPNVLYTINNLGSLTLDGTTSVADGTRYAIANSPYVYPDAQNVNVKLNVESDDVVVGKIQIDLDPAEHPQTHAVNGGVPEINISAGRFGTITVTGEGNTPVGNITGGLFGSVVPENLCGEGYIPTDVDPGTGLYTVKEGTYVARIGDVKYESVPAALAAVPTAIYPNTPAEATTITLLADVSTGFDIGVETGSLSTFKTQNVVFDLDGHTMTLGHPIVGSTGTQTQGIRVLAFSKLEMIDGSLAVDTTTARITLANYGELKLTDVKVGVGDNVLYAINNRGALTLAGETSVANGTECAIVNAPYNYPDSHDINCVLNVASEDVEVGDVIFELDPIVHPSTHVANNGVNEVNISAGSFGTITETGSGTIPVGNISGGYFDSVVPKNLCADGYIPVATQNDQGKYTVKQGAYVAEMTVNGVTTKYETINEAIANAPVDSYANGKAGQSAEKASIRLLADTTGGFDVGVETGSLATWKIQNVEINLDDHVLTLGKPLVGSTNTKTSGIRVLAYSKLSISNGTINGLNSGALRGLQNYGDVAIEDVVFENMSGTYDTIGNFGSLVLSGETVVPNGRDSAILNSTYLYSDNSQVPVTISIDDVQVEVGKVKIDLTEYTHPQTGTVNQSSPKVAISNGNFEEIFSTGSDKELVGGVTGGWFDKIVPANLCAEGYIPVTEPNENGKYTVKLGILYPTNAGKTRGVYIPLDWISANTELIKPEDDMPTQEELVQGLSAMGDNGLPLWQSYVLGCDPKGPNGAKALLLTGSYASGNFVIANIGTFVADPTAYKLDTPAGCKEASVRIRLARRGTNGEWTTMTVKVGDEYVDVDDKSSYFSKDNGGKPVFTVPVDAVFETPSAGGGAELAIVVDIIVEDAN